MGESPQGGFLKFGPISFAMPLCRTLFLYSMLLDQTHFFPNLHSFLPSGNSPISVSWVEEVVHSIPGFSRLRVLRVMKSVAVTGRAEWLSWEQNTVPRLQQFHNGWNHVQLQYGTSM